MNFSFGAPNTTGGFAVPTATPASTAPSLHFGMGTGAGDAKSPTGFQIPSAAAAAAQTKPLGSLPFATPTSGLTLGAPSAAAQPLTFGAPVSTAQQLSFGTPQAGYSFGAAQPPNKPTATTAPQQLSFGTPPINPPKLNTSALNLGSAKPTFNLGNNPSSLGLTPAATSASSGGGGLALHSVVPTLSLASAAPTLSLGTSAPTLALGSSTAPTVATSTGFSLGGNTSSSGELPFANSVSTVKAATSESAAVTSTPTFSLGTLAATSTASTTVGTTVTDSAIIPATGALTFAQLEDSINKWTVDLDEQAKLFVNQAKQLNAWDTMLISNGEKILNLNNGIERVKQQQQQLDQELDFILAQQKELEDCIAPLEKELNNIPVADEERNQTYQMAENMDSQLKQMSEDLKEIIEHLNESNKTQESSDPVAQIGRILNAHMNSLQWIDRNTAQISGHLDQITKMHDMHRRDSERTFHLAYE